MTALAADLSSPFGLHDVYTIWPQVYVPFTAAAVRCWCNEHRKGGAMKMNNLLAPRMSNKAILLTFFAYMAMVIILVTMAAKPFGASGVFDFRVSPNAVAAAELPEVEVVPVMGFMEPTVHVPAAPYLIIN